MAHIIKATRAQIGGLTRHFERYKNEKGDYIKFGNQEIDIHKTYLNYNLAENKNQLDFIKQRTSEVKCLDRKDVKVLCSWVVTLPKTIQENSGEEDEFFRETYLFLEDKYGKENVISAFVHKDETSPHIHFAFVPVIHDEIKNIDKVSAKEIITRNHLQSFHGEFDQYMKSVFGRDIGVLNEATKEGNQSIEQLKQATLKIETEKQENQLKENHLELTKSLKKLEQVKREMKEGEKKIMLLKKQINTLDKKYNGKLILDEKLSNIKPEKTFTGKIKGITLEEIQQLKNTASKVEIAKNNCNILERKNKELLLENRKLQSQIPSMKRQLEEAKKITKLENENQRLRSELQRIPKEIRKEYKNKKRDEIERS